MPERERLLDQMGFKAGDFQTLADQAEILLDRGDLEPGMAMLLRASEMARAGRGWVAQGKLLSNLGLAQERCGDAVTARQTLQQAVAVLEQTDAIADLAGALNNLGFVE